MTGFNFKIIVLLIVVVATLVVSRRMRRPDSKDSLIVRVVGGVLTGLIVLWLVSSFFAVVPANTVAIPVSFGKAGAPLQPGIHMVTPWTTTTEFSTRLQELSMLAAEDEGDLAKDDSIGVIAKGGGAMDVDLTIQFRLDETMVDEVFRDAASMEVIKNSIVRPVGREITRNEFGQFSAEEGYSTSRAEIGVAITEGMQAELAPRGIIIEQVNIRDVNPDETVLKSINAILNERNLGLQATENQKTRVTEAETKRQVAEKDAAASKIAAEAAAANSKIAAEAAAANVKTAADAQAKANQVLAESLTPELVALQLADRCTEAIANSSAQVLTICGPSAAGATAPAQAAPTVVIDGRAPAVSPAAAP